MVCLFEALKGKENIETLNLQDNFLVDTGVDGLCDFLVAAKNLKSLNLGDCNIKLAANGKIVEALEKSESVFQEFFFNYNELEDFELAKRLIDRLATKNLKKLEIKGNEFKEETQKYYIEKL